MIEMDEQMLLNHYNSIFDQKPEFSMKLGLKEAKKLKIYVYYPNSKHDFYKLVTSGCTFLYQDRNEYMMFLSKDTPVVKGTADKNLIFYPLFLLKASLIGIDQGLFLSYYDLAELSEEEARGVIYLPPFAIENEEAMKLIYKDKDINFLQVMPLSSKQFEFAKRHDTKRFSSIFYQMNKKKEIVKMNPFADDYLKRDDYLKF